MSAARKSAWLLSVLVLWPVTSWWMANYNLLGSYSSYALDITSQTIVHAALATAVTAAALRFGAPLSVVRSLALGAVAVTLLVLLIAVPFGAGVSPWLTVQYAALVLLAFAIAPIGAAYLTRWAIAGRFDNASRNTPATSGPESA